MARLPRLTLPGYPHHVIQRGNNRQPIFLDAADREVMWGLLCQYAREQQVAVHAYVLMDNHLHLLATPQVERGLTLLMQAVGRRYVRYFNQRHGRSGTLWEGRYRNTLIQAERHLLPCMAYLDLNPVRNGLCSDPAEFRWSSHGHYIGLRSDRLITPHPLYWDLGNTPFARDEAYAALVREGVSATEQRAITDSALNGWALGDADFLASLQQSTARRVVKSRAGRPPSDQDRRV
ncbi:transposase [Diaphorobacter aerolatus]|uniref:Transposase n=1 Tax=Diaphorobacter aerolatus TaxID=1288495 RepID=A0A7H0GNH3_9BURK|nr:transposase [Diaphorobacter aerolatus]QNP49839.1 transposase [Diaphorobacter aerolatus]